MLVQNFLAQAAAAPAKETSMYQSIFMVGVAALFFYFVLWRPEQKRRKKLQELRKALKKGDSVVAMGMVARVEEVREKTVILKHVDGSKVEMLSGAISEIRTPSEAKTEAKAESATTAEAKA